MGYFSEIHESLPNSFFIRKVQQGHSDDLMRWLDSAIERERLFYSSSAAPSRPVALLGRGRRTAASEGAASAAVEVPRAARLDPSLRGDGLMRAPLVENGTGL